MDLLVSTRVHRLTTRWALSRRQQSSAKSSRDLVSIHGSAPVWSDISCGLHSQQLHISKISFSEETKYYHRNLHTSQKYHNVQYVTVYTWVLFIMLQFDSFKVSCCRTGILRLRTTVTKWINNENQRSFLSGLTTADHKNDLLTLSPEWYLK